MIINTLQGLSGIVLFTLLTALITYFNKGFDGKEMIKNNYKVWVVSAVIVLMVAGVSNYAPSVIAVIALTIQESFGLDITSIPENYFLFGFGIVPILKARQNRSQLN